MIDAAPPDWGLAGFLLAGLADRCEPGGGERRRNPNPAPKRRSAPISPAGTRSTCAITRRPPPGSRTRCAADPASPELITRTFLMEASVGRFDRARALAESELKLDATDAIAELVLLIDRVAGGRQSRRAEARRSAARGRGAPICPAAGARLDAHGGRRCTGADAALQELRQVQRLCPAQILPARPDLRFCRTAPIWPRRISRKPSRRADSSIGG